MKPAFRRSWDISVPVGRSAQHADFTGASAIAFAASRAFQDLRSFVLGDHALELYEQLLFRGGALRCLHEARLHPAAGLLFGNPKQLLIQFIAVSVSAVFAFVGSLVLLKITDVLVGLRVDDESEETGLDLSEHDENGYALDA
jgi:hypothetical protein